MAQGKKRRARGTRSRGRNLLSGQPLSLSSRSRALTVEQLEDRRMLAVFTVTNLGDLQRNDDNELETAPGTLRAAIEAANDNEEADIIYFNESLSGTIFLQATNDAFGQLTITDTLSIVGLGAKKIGVEAAGGRRVFEVTAEGEDPIGVSIEGITISGGTAVGSDEDGRGGAIYNNENLTLTEVEIANSTATLGGGVFNTGSLTVTRSLLRDNSALSNGGGIHNGVPSDSGSSTDEAPPRVTINNSTISGNQANRGSGYGGGLFNQDGEMTVTQCTIVGNSAYLGSGIGSWGNALPEEEGGDPPAPTIFTTVSGSILFKNTDVVEGEDTDIDIDVVGKGEEMDGEAPDLAPSINIDGMGMPGAVGGNNDIFGLGKQVSPSMGDLPAGTDPLLISTDDDEPMPILGDYGGSTLTYHPIIEVNPDTGIYLSPVVNHHTGGGGGSFDQRGRFFVRTYDPANPMMPHRDIGAVEVQVANFVVDVYSDEFNDGQYSSGTGGVASVGDFSIREALDFSAANPLVDTVSFSISGGVDPTASSAPTILLNNGQLTVNHSVNIVGPSSFVFEIDAGSTGPGGSSGSRVLMVSDGDDANAVDVTVKNLTLLGGGVAGSGGAIFSHENLTLDRSTIKGSFASLDGAGVFHATGNLTINGSTITGNESADDAAVYIDPSSGPVVISNTTISGNTAGDRGAGIFNRGSDTKIMFSTITNNTPGSTRGGGLLNFTGGHVEVYSSIISGNVFNNDVEAFMGGTGEIVSMGYNLVGAGNAIAAFSAANGDKFTTDPRLAPLTLSGGVTPVHVLLEDSPAIDAGDPTAVAGMNGVPEFDERGAPFVRVDPDVGIIDIGAYELQGVTFVVDNTGDASNGNYSMGNVTLREAIELANSSPKKDFITFDVSLLGRSISAGQLAITDTVEIIGLGSPMLTVGGTSGPVFLIDNGDADTFIDVDISGLTLSGRSISSSENVSLNDVDIRGNLTSAISHQLGTLRLEQSTLTGNTSGATGGGIRASNANVEIYSTTIAGNSTNTVNGHGGGIFLQNSSFYGYDMVLTGNFTFAGAADGGAIYATDSDLELEFSVVSGNTTSGANSDGAGIFGKNSDFYVHEYSTIALNTTFGTSSKGGAVYLNGGNFTIADNTTVILNKTLGQFSSGGFLASVGADVTIEQTNISQNSTNGPDAHGGAIYIQEGNLLLDSSAVYDNATSGLRSDGGGIYSDTDLAGKQTTILNSTISGNSTQDRGGGVYNSGGLTVIRHSTISNNAAPYFGFGSGVGTFGNTTTTRTDVGSSIIAGNVVSAPLAGNVPSDVDRIGGTFQDSFHSLGYNIIGTGITSAFSSATHDSFGIADPGLGILTNNGGPTFTHELLAGSPAINAGDPAAVAGTGGVPEFDQRGEERVRNGRIDVGAVESDYSPSVSGDFDGNGFVNGLDFLAWQRGESPDPLSSGDLGDWETNFGTSASEAAAIQAEEVVASSAPVSLLNSEPLQAAPLVAEPESAPTIVAVSTRSVAATPQDVGDTPADQLLDSFTTDSAWWLTPMTSVGVETAFDVLEEPADLEFLPFQAVPENRALGVPGELSESAQDMSFDVQGTDDEAGEPWAEDLVFDLIGLGNL